MYNCLMQFSPFRLCLILSLPLVVCLGFWLSAQFLSIDRGLRSSIRWTQSQMVYPSRAGQMSDREWDDWMSHLRQSRVEFPGFHYVQDQFDSKTPEHASHVTWRYVSINYWLLTLLSTLPLILYFLLTRRRRRTTARIRRGLCPTCAYDLRAHTAGQSYPECGTPIAKT